MILGWKLDKKFLSGKFSPGAGREERNDSARLWTRSGPAGQFIN